MISICNFRILKANTEDIGDAQKKRLDEEGNVASNSLKLRKYQIEPNALLNAIGVASEYTDSTGSFFIKKKLLYMADLFYKGKFAENQAR